LSVSVDPQGLRRYQTLTQAAMLASLHLALTLDLGSAASRAFLLAHFGLFLIWQPVWQGTEPVVSGRALLALLGAVVFVWWADWWLVGLWIALVFSLIGGSVPTVRQPRARAASLLAALYLLAMLLMWVVPRAFHVGEFPELVVVLVRYGLVVPIVVIPFMRFGKEGERPVHALDVVYGFLLFLLVIVLVLGAFFVQQVTRGDYAMALAKTLVVIAAIMLLLAWLWDPRGGFAGIGQTLSRYFLSVGMPFERWMYSLAALAEREPDPARFLTDAVVEMRQLPWLSAVGWSYEGARGGTGVATGHGTDFDFAGLRLTLYTRFRPSPALLVHMRLLAQLLADYHEMKVREQTERRTAYLQAIYETGSRLTHDVKNLLQSLRSLCAAADMSGAEDAEALRRLIRRQLPQIAQRLQATLDKLDSGRLQRVEWVPAAEWWRNLVQRYGHEGIVFRTSGLGPDERLPGELFDSVADNLLQNALEKRRRQETRGIVASLECGGKQCSLAVSDAGEAIPTALAEQLFSAAVASESGLGVGLYQSARLAAELGYRLALDANRDGEVTFTLRPVARETPPRAAAAT
jgi:signal transduction histidine kinase